LMMQFIYHVIDTSFSALFPCAFKICPISPFILTLL
jgi:hypothetical protein